MTNNNGVDDSYGGEEEEEEEEDGGSCGPLRPYLLAVVCPTPTWGLDRLGRLVPTTGC